MSAHPKKAASVYRQLRCTLTVETGGRASYSVYAKGLNEDWKAQHCIVRSTVRDIGTVNSTEEAIAALVIALEQHLLPGVGPTTR